MKYKQIYNGGSVYACLCVLGLRRKIRGSKDVADEMRDLVVENHDGNVRLFVGMHLSSLCDCTLTET